MPRVVHAEQYTDALDAYLAVPGHGPAFETRDVVAWALAQEPPLLGIEPDQEAAYHMANLAWLCRNEKGPGRARRMHCVREEYEDAEGVMRQRYIWGREEDAPPDFLRTSFRQRRDAILTDCRQLKRDVDHFNAGRPPAQHHQLTLDFTAEAVEGTDAHF